MVYTLLFFSSKCSLFHNSNVFGSSIIHIYYAASIGSFTKMFWDKLSILSLGVKNPKESLRPIGALYKEECGW